MEYYILLGFLAVVAAYPGIIHDEGHHEVQYEHHAPISESGHHHQVEHEHENAKSHQSIKFEHFHAVPVYVKKEHSHLLKHPVEKGKSEQNLKLVHPKTEHSHGDGLVLEDERHNTEHEFEHHEGGLEHGGFEHGGYEHHQGFEGYGGGEELKGFGEHHEHESEGHHFEHGHSFGGDGGEGYKFEGY